MNGNWMPRDRPEELGAAIPKILAASNPLQGAADLATHAGSKSIRLPSEILEVAEELVAGCDNPGIEKTKLELLLRVVLYLDRQGRGEAVPTA